MFDILTDAWAHPGAVHAPILPLDITGFTAADIDFELSTLHKYGFDSLLIRCEADAEITKELLDALFAAAAKRYMPIFVDESVAAAVVGCSDRALVSYNPMLAAHRLVLVSEAEAASLAGERVLDVYIALEDGRLCDVKGELDAESDGSGYEKYSFVMVSTDGLELLCPECAETFLYSTYSSFIDEYAASSNGAFVGLYTRRLLEYTGDVIFWSFDMLSDMLALGCTEKMLVSLFIEGDRRSEKDGRRLYLKALSSRLDRAFCTPASELCGHASLAFMGDAPQLFAAGCARRFTLPMWSREGYPESADNTEDVLSALRLLGDTARGEGFTGAVYRATATNADSLVRELNAVFAAPMTLAVLPDCFADTQMLEGLGLGRAEMKRLCMRLKRESTVGTSCGCHTHTAVLCDGDIIPYTGAAKLRSMGVEFNFISKEQLLERAHIHHGEILIDKFRYKALLWDQRIRMEPDELVKIGKFATFGGALYRGGAFGDWAKKNLKISDTLRELSSSVTLCRLDKCGYTFLRLANRSEECVSVTLGGESGQCYALDADSGKNYRIGSDEKVRLMPGEMRTFMFDDSQSPITGGECPPLAEVFALREGDNVIPFSRSEAYDAVIQLDSLGGSYVELEVNGKKQPRLLYPPYSLNVTDAMNDGDNSVRVSGDGTPKGALVRIRGVK